MKEMELGGVRGAAHSEVGHHAFGQIGSIDVADPTCIPQTHMPLRFACKRHEPERHPAVKCTTT